MATDQDKSIKDVEAELAESRERSKALDKEIERAEAKHPSDDVDHTEDGGVI